MTRVPAWLINTAAAGFALWFVSTLDGAVLVGLVLGAVVGLVVTGCVTGAWYELDDDAARLDHELDVALGIADTARGTTEAAPLAPLTTHFQR